MELIAGEIYDIVNVPGWGDRTFKVTGIEGRQVCGVYLFTNGYQYSTSNFCALSDAHKYLKPTFTKDSNIPEIW